MKQLHKVVELIQEAKRPLIFAGGGVILSEASEELTKLARKNPDPGHDLADGAGRLSGYRSFVLGMIGMHGTYRANMSIGNCDLMIAVGVRFDDRVTGKTDAFAPQAKIVHIDIDPDIDPQKHSGGHSGCGRLQNHPDRAEQQLLEEADLAESETAKHRLAGSDRRVEKHQTPRL